MSQLLCSTSSCPRSTTAFIVISPPRTIALSPSAISLLPFGPSSTIGKHYQQSIEHYIIRTYQASARIMPVDGHFDPLGECEPENTIYTLTVRCPPRPSPKWLPSFIARKPVTYSRTYSTYTIIPDDTNPDLDCYEEKHLNDMPTKVVKIKRALFPLEMRCWHLRYVTTCEEGCYVLERGGDIERWRCKRSDCNGHVYCGRVKADGDGKACFGKKGEMMVCLE
jgi:hypothetical protein